MSIEYEDIEAIVVPDQEAMDWITQLITEKTDATYKNKSYTILQ